MSTAQPSSIPPALASLPAALANLPSPLPTLTLPATTTSGALLLAGGLGINGPTWSQIQPQPQPVLTISSASGATVCSVTTVAGKEKAVFHGEVQIEQGLDS